MRGREREALFAVGVEVVGGQPSNEGTSNGGTGLNAIDPISMTPPFRSMRRQEQKPSVPASVTIAYGCQSDRWAPGAQFVADLLTVVVHSRHDATVLSGRRQRCRPAP